MKKIIAELEERFHIDEYDISSAFRTLLSPDQLEVSKELQAEIMAFDFFENHEGQNGWGTYFGPSAVWNNGDGTFKESPSIKLVDSDILKYWTIRINETSNPLLKARYSGLVWDFTKHVTHKSPDYKIGLVYIDNLLDIAEKKLHKSEYGLSIKITRALSLAISLSNTSRILRAKEIILSFENGRSRGFSGFSYKLLVGNDKVQLGHEEELKIINDLEENFKYSSEGEHLDPFYAERSAELLAEYYKKKNRKDDVKRIIYKLGDAYQSYKPHGTAMQVHVWLQQLHSIYTNYGFTEKADEILSQLRELGPKINEELKPVPFSFEISEDEINAIYEKIIEYNSDGILHSIIGMFIPNVDFQKKQLDIQSSGSSFLSIIPTMKFDSTGRNIATVGPLKDDPEGNLINQLSTSVLFSTAYLRLILRKLIDEKKIDIEVLMNFVERSPLFNESALKIIRRGIEAYFQQDFLIAMHLLMPQIEEGYRQLIEKCGGVTLKNTSGGFQLKTFSELIKEDVQRDILGPNVPLYFQTLFTDKRGWNLRNNLCHGLIDVNAFSFQASDRVIHSLLILGGIRSQNK